MGKTFKYKVKRDFALVKLADGDDYSIETDKRKIRIHEKNGKKICKFYGKGRDSYYFDYKIAEFDEHWTTEALKNLDYIVPIKTYQGISLKGSSYS